MPNYYEIDEQTARRAKEAYSWDSYQPGSATAGYRAAVDVAAEIAEQQKKRVSPFYYERIDAALDRYAKRLADWTNKHNANIASCPSSYITGGSNYARTFGRKHEKQQGREDALWSEYNEIQAIREKIKEIGTGPVDLTDPHAREILTERLEKLQKKQARAKEINAHMRKRGTFKGLDGISDEAAARLDAAAKEHAPDLKTYKPYPDYELASLREKIKRTAARLEELDRLQARQDVPDETSDFPGGQIVRNAELNRLQLIFDGKPADNVREVLKSNGFKWSPKNQAWQRQLTQNAEYSLAHYVLPALTAAE